MILNKILTLAVLVGGSVLLQAQNETNLPPAASSAASPSPRGHANFDVLAKQLDLTEDQKPKVTAALDDLQQSVRALRQDLSLSAEQRNAKMKAITDAANAKMKAILTEDQFAKWGKIGQPQRPPAAPPQP